MLDLSGGRIFSVNPDGTGSQVLVTGCQLPDGIAVDVEGGHIYWTNMGVPNRNDGSIERADLDGRNRKTIIPQGGTFTPKQLQLDKENGKLYWCDREQWHLGGGEGGIKHFMDHLMEPLAGMMKVLGTPNITPHLKQTIIDGVLRESAGHSVAQLAKKENEVIIGLLRLRVSIDNGASDGTAR